MLLPSPNEAVAGPATPLNGSSGAAAAKRASPATNAGLGRAPRLKPPAMQFLKTLLWVVIAVFLAILASRNWHDVTLNLWGDIQADIKVPVLIFVTFLLGWLPLLLLHRAKVWRLRQRLDSFERQQAALREREAAAAVQDETPAI